MLKLIARHDLEENLDWICEAQWDCPELPRRQKLPSAFELSISKPKADLAVAFKTRSIISQFQDIYFESLLTQIRPEKSARPGVSREDRSFHFFAVEAMRTSASDPEKIALHQSLNVASLALRNLYALFREADMQDVFFEKARFFSATAGAYGVTIRIHRAMKAEPKFLIRSDYPLVFLYDDLYTSKRLEREDLLHVVRTIFSEYGIATLLPRLHEAVKKIVERPATQRRSPSQSPHARKRPADGLAESFTSQRMRLGDLNVSEDRRSASWQCNPFI